MTNEEAIKDIQDNILPVVGGKSLLMAIEALRAQDAKDAKPMPSQLPSGDTIYRQAAITALHDEIVRRRISKDTNDDGALDEFDTEEILRRLPPAQPKMVCVANVTLTEEQVREMFKKVKRYALSVIEQEKTKQTGYQNPTRKERRNEN